MRSTGNLPWHQRVVAFLITPFQKGVTFIGDGVSGVWNRYFYLVGVSEENSGLRRIVDEQKRELNSLTEVRYENTRLRKLLGFAEGHSLEVVGAKVVANDPRGDFRVITIDRGRSEGVEPNMAVVSASGLVGRVAEVSNHISRILLITDPNNAVDVLDQRSRERALLVGSTVGTELKPDFYLSRLEYLSRKTDMLDGDIVVTSGLDDIYPAGIPVGVVSDMEHNSHGVFKNANVIPFNDFSNIEEVLIVKR